MIRYPYDMTPYHDMCVYHPGLPEEAFSTDVPCTAVQQEDIKVKKQSGLGAEREPARVKCKTRKQCMGGVVRANGGI